MTNILDTPGIVGLYRFDFLERQVAKEIVNWWNGGTVPDGGYLEQYRDSREQPDNRAAEAHFIKTVMRRITE